MKRMLGSVMTVAALVLGLGQLPSYAANTPLAGKSCLKIGTTKVISGVQYTCKKVGKKSYWSVAPKKTPSLLTPPVSSIPTATAAPVVSDPSKFLLYSPIDPNNVVKLSKFRSCVGHDYSPGLSAKFQGKPATNLEIARSMKHYLYLKDAFTPANTIKGYAPFDGTIRITSEQSGNGKQVFVMNPSGWTFIYFHGDPLVTEGQSVTAGTAVIAWWSMDQEAFAKSTNATAHNSSVDMALINFQQGAYASPFDYFQPAILQAWRNRGFDPAQLIISKQDRDARPCVVGPDGERFSGAADASDYVQAK